MFLKGTICVTKSPSRINSSKLIFWLYILGIQFNLYQNITEIWILFSNKVLGTADVCVALILLHLYTDIM